MALLGFLMVVPTVAIILELEIDNAFDVWLPNEAPQVVFDEELRETFPRDQVLVALFEGDDLLSDAFLAALQSVTRAMERHDLVERVLTVTNVDQIRGTADGFVVDYLLSPEVAATLTREERRMRVLDDRFAPGLLVSKDARTMALVVRPKRIDNSIDRWRLQSAFEQALEEAGIADHLAGLSGNIALDVAQLTAALRDTAIFVPATTGLGLLLIWWMFRRLLAVALAAAAITAVSTSTVALLVVADQPFTLIAAMIAPLMSALTVALLVHLFTGLTRASRRGATGLVRMASALAMIRGPALYTAMTTAAGLTSLAVSEIPPIRSFGLCSALGALLVYFVVVVLLPSLIYRWDHGNWTHVGRFGRAVDRVIDAISRIGIRHAGWVVAVAVIGFVVGAPQIARVTAESDMYEFFPDSHPLTIATKKVGDRLTGVNSLQVVFDGPGRDSLLSRDRLAFISDFQKWLDAQPGVDRTTSMVEVIEEMHWAFNEEDPAFRSLPEDPQLIRQYLFIYDGTDLFDLVDREYERTVLAVNLAVRGANQTRDVIQRIRGHLDAADTRGMDYEVAGFGRLFADQVDLLISGQIHGLWTAFGIIFLLMVLLWRSFWQSVLCMIPNFAPVALIFIIMGAAGIWLDMATALIASVTVGIAVDDTIHVFYGYRARRRAGAGITGALVTTYRHAGRAVVITTVILVGQFLLLTTSDFIPTVQFGLLTAIGLMAALALDLLFLPALIVIVARLWPSFAR